MGCLR